MKVLVACEFSGIVRDAFAARGHDAWSCDLLPTERPGQHIQDNVLNRLTWTHWDLLIAHPPCTYLCNSGVRWLVPRGKRDTGRWELMIRAAELFTGLWTAPVKRICIENPIMHGYAKHAIGSLSGLRELPQTQIIHPWQYGHAETKATCLWLRNLPELQPTQVVEGRSPRVHFASPGPDRWKERSRTMRGIADAMAAQWGDLQV